MNPLAILPPTFALAAVLSGVQTGWDIYPIACIALLGLVTLTHYYFQTYGARADVPRAMTVYLMAIVLTGQGLILERMMRAYRARQPHYVSVFYNGTCETLQVVKPLARSLLVYDGSTYAYLHRGDITRISPTPGCGPSTGNAAELG